VRGRTGSALAARPAARAWSRPDALTRIGLHAACCSGHDARRMTGPELPAPISFTIRLNGDDVATFAKGRKSEARGLVEALFGLLFGPALCVMIVIFLAADLPLASLCAAAVVVLLVGLSRAQSSTTRRSLEARAAFASGTLTLRQRGAAVRIAPRRHGVPVDRVRRRRRRRRLPRGGHPRWRRVAPLESSL
jgi:hypothetical protein